jgi:hypothetical protein
MVVAFARALVERAADRQLRLVGCFPARKWMAVTDARNRQSTHTGKRGDYRHHPLAGCCENITKSVFRHSAACRLT